MIQLERNENVFTLVMDAGENRWNTTFVRELDRVLDEVEATSGPAALITTSSSDKFYSNGLDLDWVQNPAEHPDGGDRETFGDEFMKLMSRLITFPIPTIAAINGHAFGAGFMSALCHDVRIMREDRGYVCANEMAIGLTIPIPELALFKHKLPANTFFETVQLARRWTGSEALNAGIVQATATSDRLPQLARERAAALAPLAANRTNYGAQKEAIYGEDAAINGPHGAAYMLRNLDDYRH